MDSAQKAERDKSRPYAVPANADHFSARGKNKTKRNVFNPSSEERMLSGSGRWMSEIISFRKE